MGEVLSAWSDTIKLHQGIFSKALKFVYLSLYYREQRMTSHLCSYDDPFYHSVSYSPTDKETIDRGLAQARRILTPHALVLQMLFSRLQAARYHRPGVMLIIQHLVLRTARAFRTMRCVSSPQLITFDIKLVYSTHALSREVRFSFLLFGFETLKSSHLDSYCENALRESLYKLAFSWFTVRPQYVHSSCVQSKYSVCFIGGHTEQTEFKSTLTSKSSPSSYPIFSRIQSGAPPQYLAYQ